MSGLTPEGFDRKRLVDIKIDIENALKLAFGNNIDITPESGFGQFIGILSEALSDQWESQENVYNALYPSTAQGNQLSNVVMFNGIKRQKEVYSTVVGTLTGAKKTKIPAGSKASVQSTRDFFVTLTDSEIPENGVTFVPLQSETAGAIEAVAGTLTKIETPIFGWESITNTSDAFVGKTEETDTELRIRRRDSIYVLGNNLVDSLYGQLLSLDGVKDAVVISNGSDIVVDGIPPHQFLVSIIGGSDEEIVKTIWANTPQGIASFGNTMIEHPDIQGYLQPVMFTRPSEVPIYFKIYITTNYVEFHWTQIHDIKQAIVDYGLKNFKISDDVIRTEFFTPINSIPGILTIDLKIGLNAIDISTDNIYISNDKISIYDISCVEVYDI